MSKITSLIFPVFLVLTSCLSKENKKDKQVFHLNLHAGFTSLDPAFSRNQANIQVCKQLYNGLLKLNDSLEPVADIAKRWEVNEAGTEYTFYLRDGVFFHNHPLFENKEERRVTAGDFVYSFNRIIDPATASPGAWIFNAKVKIREVNGKKKGSFYALNDTTLLIRLKKPFPPFPGLLTMPYCSVLPKEITEHYGKEFRIHPVGTGPFQLDLYRENQRLILVKNPGYFKSRDGRQLPFLDAVEFFFIPGKQKEFLAFLQGDLDFLSGIDGSFKDHLLTRNGRLHPRFKGKFKMEKIPYLNTEYLGILMDTTNKALRNSPLRRKKIRQAVSYGFDREKMLRYLRNNIGRPGTNGFVPRGLPAFDTQAVQGYTYRPEKARALLREAGFPGGKGLPEITLYTNKSYLDLCIYIEKQLNETGIPVKVEVVPSSMLREWMAQSKVLFFRGSWIADYPDAENYLALFYSKNFAPDGPNYTHFSSARFDSLYEQASATAGRSERIPLYHRMENLVMEQAPVVVLYYDEVVRLVQNNIRGLNRNPINRIDLEKVRKGK